MRTPKPEGVARKPRFKKRKGKQMGRPHEGVRQKLQALIAKQGRREDLDEWFKQTGSEDNPRGAAILLATNVENSLDAALLALMVPDRARPPDHLQLDRP